MLWTRLAPDPLSADPAAPGGMTGGDVPVGYEIASDPAMGDIVRRGVAAAEQAYAYSVHADISGLVRRPSLLVPFHRAAKRQARSDAP